MKVKAAVLGGVGQDWEIREIELGDPVAHEVQVKLTASGLCHSDEHLRTGASPVPFFPVIGGHEGAGVVTKVGPGVTDLKEGDHVVLAFEVLHVDAVAEAQRAGHAELRVVLARAGQDVLQVERQRRERATGVDAADQHGERVLS